jgi:hypothetical protein
VTATQQNTRASQTPPIAAARLLDLVNLMVELIKEFGRHQRWMLAHELLDLVNALAKSHHLGCPPQRLVGLSSILAHRFLPDRALGAISGLMTTECTSSDQNGHLGAVS